jgi:hypothetical protein
MVKNIKVISLKIRDMVKVDFDGKMGENMKENGKEGNNMELVFIKMGREKIKKDNGLKVKEFNGYHDNIFNIFQFY